MLSKAVLGQKSNVETVLRSRKQRLLTFRHIRNIVNLGYIGIVIGKIGTLLPRQALFKPLHDDLIQRVQVPYQS